MTDRFGLPAGASGAAAPAEAGYDAIVIGGSSGSIEALSVLLPALPADLRAAVIVVLHLPRERRSLLAEIFRHRCTLPMQEAQDQQRIAPGHLYFAPPDYHLLVDEGPRLALSVDAPVHFSRPAIDVLFESAADCYGPRLMSVLLSGANQDGADGSAAVQAAGGLVVVQQPASASMAVMPTAALRRVPTAQALAPEDMAGLIAALHRQQRL